MAIQNRRGSYEKLNTGKLLPGEYAIVLQNDPHCKDGKAAYICFKAGDVKRISTYEDMLEDIDKATDYIEKLYTDEVRKATQNANDEAMFANIQGVYATEQGDYAKSQGVYAEKQGSYAKTEGTSVRSEFELLKDTLAGIQNGELLLEIKDMLEAMYVWATDMDIDNIISGEYVDIDENGGFFDTATDEDIDKIIEGTFVESDEEDPEDMADADIQKIIDDAFKEV